MDVKKYKIGAVIMMTTITTTTTEIMASLFLVVLYCCSVDRCVVRCLSVSFLSAVHVFPSLLYWYNADMSPTVLDLDRYISSHWLVGQFCFEWFLLTSANRSFALSVQTIHVVCWQQLPSGAAGARPDADLLPLSRRREGRERRRGS